MQLAAKELSVSMQSNRVILHDSRKRRLARIQWNTWRLLTSGNYTRISFENEFEAWDS